jgi:hypothetical protein
MRALYKEGIAIPTANHGFGWDAMTLCARALIAAKGDPSAAIECLESGILIDGATGLFRFSRKDHNGRARFNPTTFSRISNGRIEEVVRKDKVYESAKRRALTRLEKGFNLRWRPPATRHELHER